MAWLVTYHYPDGRQIPHLVYTIGQVQKLIDERPAEARCEVQPVAKEDLRRPDEGDESI